MSIPLPQVPILMYHAIARPGETSSRLAVSPSAFGAQLAFLHSEGFKTITVCELSAVLNEDAGKFPDRTIVLTFDDGYEDFHSQAMPLLERYGFTATVFITTGWVKDAGPPLGQKRPGRMLSWSQITEAAHAGIEIGGHSLHHPELDRLPEKLLRDELYTSRAQIEEKLGTQVTGLAYPFGYSNVRVRRAAREIGYDYGCAVSNMMVGPEPDLFALPRLTVGRSMAMPAFHQVVRGRIPMMLLKDRILTKGWAVVRRSRATFDRVLPTDKRDPSANPAKFSDGEY
jgi:peptidoglycan/xylan/chitin deacetylase (PgdA/CDA1 family)